MKFFSVTVCCLLQSAAHCAWAQQTSISNSSSATDSTNTTRMDSEDLARLYEDVFFSYQVWPSIDKNASAFKDGNTRPIEVVLGTIFVSIDSIDPGSSEFTVTSRNLFFYKEDDCNQTMVHQAACRDKISERFKFVRAQKAKGDSTRNMQYDVESVYQQEFEELGMSDVQPGALYVDNQITYAQTFDMSNFPYEFHNLDVVYRAAFSSNVVKLTPMPTIDPGVLKPSVPPGWDLRGVKCTTSRNAGNAALQYLSSDFYEFRCAIQVSKYNDGWWMTSFLLFCGLIFLSFIAGLGVASRYVADARDDKESARRALYEGTRIDGTFVAGLLLTYVFQVQLSPYGKSLEYWGDNTPTSTMIYVLGLVAITAMSAAGLVGSIVFMKPIKPTGFDGGLSAPYNLELVPKEDDEGISGDDQPLIRESNSCTNTKSNDDTESFASANTAPFLSRSRKNNQKEYTVLSVEEAQDINRFIKRLVIFKVCLLSAVFSCAIAILVVARVSFDNSVREATSSSS